MKDSRSRFVELRGLRLHLREWGRPGAPRLYFLHGWMDASVSFQFIVDALAADWHVIAPDWRGFGQSGWTPADGYWFADYFADLDAILRLYEDDDAAAVRLVGHSMGGNIALMYAGIRPQRVAQVIALDAFGMLDRAPEEAPGRYRQWLDQLRQPQPVRVHADQALLARQLRKANPRLPADRADWLASAIGQQVDGGWRVAGDPRHKRVNPVLYRRAEAQACWREITAAVLSIEPEDASLRLRLGIDDDTHAAAHACFRQLEVVRLADCGHNLHHDQPAVVARLIEDFVDRHPQPVRAAS